MTVPKIKDIFKHQKKSFEPPQEFLDSLRASKIVYVATASTSPSTSVRTDAMSSWSPSGDGVRTVAEYKREYGCGVNAVSRLRALSLLLPGGSEAFIDLDSMGGAEKQELIKDVFSRTVVCAESASLMGYAVQLAPDLAPALVLDLSIVVRVLYPDLPYELARRAADGDERAQAELARRDHHPCSLSSISAALGLSDGAEYAKWPDGRGWTLGTLCQSHESALSSRALRVSHALEALTGATTRAGLLVALGARDVEGEFFSVFERAPIELARIHARGMRIDLSQIDAIEQDASDRLSGLVADVINAVPELGAVRDELESVSRHGSSAIRKALGAYASRLGHPFKCDTQGLPRIGSVHVTLAGAAGLPGLQAWQALEAAKRAMSSAASLRTHGYSSVSGERRIHPMLTVHAVTGRLSCSEPNAQGMDAVAKSAIIASDGCVLIEADFGAIEIRIAAAQAVQVLREAEDVISGRRPAAEWVRRSLLRGRDKAGIPKPGLRDAPWDQLAYWYGRTLAIGTPLVDLLAAGLCPHDYTSLGMLDRAGGLSMPEGMTRVEYMSATPRHTLRAMVCRRRPAAKVANFGLLYLISLKGLWEKGVIDGVAWSEHEASQLHASWYEDFPEVRFTQEFILATCRDANQELMTVQDRYGAGLEAKPIRLHRSKTLGGREIVTHDDRVINARAQGTGATIALKALVDAPACIRSVVLMLVHDSVLIQAPTEKADFFAAELVSCMTAAASAYLTAWGVPVVVETKRGKNWGALS